MTTALGRRTIDRYRAGLTSRSVLDMLHNAGQISDEDYEATVEAT